MRTSTKGSQTTASIAIALSLAVIAGACSSGGGSKTTAARKGTIPQPVVQNLTVAPASARVDVALPTFTRPTQVTNPLFPVSKQKSVLFLGTVDKQPFRTEVTLLPETRIIEWAGQKVETLISQYVAFLSGRLHEVAYDFYAQDDAGAVWYFGEDVFNFADGAIVDTHGTWIAGRDGPAAMIMPANPKVGDVYRPENIPGFVFEEVTVKSVGKSLDGPMGAVPGGLVIEELHMDGSTEAKAFAPGYGEFRTGGGGDVEPLALAVPTDAVSAPTPAELRTIEVSALEAFRAAGKKDWTAAAAAVKRTGTAWTSYTASPTNALIAPLMKSAFDALSKAVAARNAAGARQAAIETTRLALDLQLRHRAPAEVDLARFDLWAAQLLVDAAAKDEAAVNHDLFALDYVRDRIQHTLDATTVTRLNTLLEELQVALNDGDLAAAARVASQIREGLQGRLGR